MPCGQYRCVVFLGRYVVKFPRLRNVLAGLQCNRWEREMWYVWHPIFHWETLCPIILADPFGLVVVMPRAVQPVSHIDLLLAPDYYPEVSGEFKASDCGRVGGRLVTFDYGLPDKEFVSNYRDRYKRMARGGAARILRPSVAELSPAAQVLHAWAAGKPFVRRLWIYGSRAKGTARPDSDLDMAVEIDPVGNDEDAGTSFISEAEGWRNELRPLLGGYDLHLEWYDQSNHAVWAGANEGIQIYDRGD